MAMFKPKKKAQALPVDNQDEVEEIEMESEEEIEDEETQEEPVKETKKKSSPKKSAYSVGEIIPIEQVIGYNVVEAIDEEGNPLVVSTDKLSEAKILSFIYQQ